MKTAQEKQGYRVKSAQPVCGNCKHCVVQLVMTTVPDLCLIGTLNVDIHLGTCPQHEWRK